MKKRKQKAMSGELNRLNKSYGERVHYKLWYHGECFYNPWYSYPEPYEQPYGAYSQSVEHLDPLHPKVCPHCHNNSASLQRDFDDLFCFTCGWRDAGHFNQRLNDFIRWVIKREKMFGSPTLLSDLERMNSGKWDGYYRNYYRMNRTKLITQHRRYNEAHKEQARESNRRYKEKNRELINFKRRANRAEARELVAV